MNIEEIEHALGSSKKILNVDKMKYMISLFLVVLYLVLYNIYFIFDVKRCKVLKNLKVVVRVGKSITDLLLQEH